MTNYPHRPGPKSFAPPKLAGKATQALYGFWEMVDEGFGAPATFARDALKPQHYYYPSQASVVIVERGVAKVKGSCLRRIYWERTGEPITNPAPLESLWKMESGNWMSAMVVEHLKRRGVFLAEEVPFVDPDNKTSGRADIFYKHPVLKKAIGVEMKSVGGYQSCKGVVAGFPLQPKFAHVLQVAVYLDFFDRKFGIDRFDLVYYARCTGERSAFVCTIDPKSREVFIDGRPSGVTPKMIYNRFASVDLMIETKVLPERDFQVQYPDAHLQSLARLGHLTKKQKETVLAGKKLKKGDPECGYCCYKDKCWTRTGKPRD